MDKLRVRIYNVRFGDAILVSVPDRNAGGEPQTRHILIDVGNVLSGEGGDDVVFRPVIENVLEVLDGRHLDLYVMTHDHLDHVQGLLHASDRLGLTLDVRHAWLTGSAAEDYYDTYPDARKRLLDYEDIRRLLQASPERETPWIHTMMLNNNPRSTTKCVEYLRNLADSTAYVYRGCDLDDKHPFREARFHIWAPEEDTSDYYGRFEPMALGVTRGDDPDSEPSVTMPTPPSGVDAGAFYDLVESRRSGYADNLLAIDRAANNTSVVFCLEWRDWKLLFPGDAEHRSWKTMDKHDQLKPVHFLKASHHGSHTGLPRRDLLDKILPMPPLDDRRRRAVVSTYPDTYKDVPDKHLLDTELTPRCEVQYVEKGTVPDGGHLPDFEFEG